MNTLELEQNITAYYVKALSFPEGVEAAHKALHSLMPYDMNRKYFGISHGAPDGKTLYLAAAAELVPGDLKKHDLPEFIIRKGKYSYRDIHDFMQNISELSETFQQLLKHPDLDPKGYCLEWYLSDKICRCLVKLKD